MDIRHKDEIGTLVAGYRAAFAAALTAFLLKKKSSDDTKQALRTAVLTFLIAAFLTGFKKSSGHEELNAEDRLWIDVRMAAEIGFTISLVDSLARIDASDMSEAEAQALANERAAGYAATLIAVFNQGLLRGDRRIYLTMTGVDGIESCRTCQRLKGRRKPARWWIDNDMIPGEPGNPNYLCRGYRCQHYLIDDNGSRYTAAN